MAKRAVSVIMLALLVVCMLTVALNIRQVRSEWIWGDYPIYIRADGSVDPDTAPISTVDNVTYFLTDSIRLATDRPYGIEIEKDDIVFDGGGCTLYPDPYWDQGTGISLTGRNNVTIKNVRIRGFYQGIYLGESSNITLAGNNITASDSYGIQIYNSSNNAVSGNTLTNDALGILVGTFSEHNHIYGNYITTASGIQIYNSADNVVSGNTFANNRRGIDLYSSEHNYILGNNITDGFWGISFQGSSSNSISGNNIAHNKEAGIYCVGSSDNLVYQNIFVNNTQQVDIEETSGHASFWDNGTWGNYWSDYRGMDRNGDAIGDTPYMINENNQDNYPLMKSPFEHELVASMGTSIYLITQPGVPISLNATVTNHGSTDESSIELVLLINGVVADSEVAAFLESCDSYTLSYLWTPTARGEYNVTVYAYPISGEELMENNQDTKFITVCPIGVKAGDWIRYEYTITDAPPETPIPTWMKVEILSVEGTTVTVRLTMHMANGTEGSETLTLDLANTMVYDTGGAFDTFFGFGFVIPANSTVGGDNIYIVLLSPRFGLGGQIDDEITETYAEASRTAVYKSFSYIGDRYGNKPLKYYWDKRTGVMVEASATLLDGMTITAKVTETNMWGVLAGEVEAAPFWMQWWFYAIVAAVIVALGGAVYFLKKRKPSTPTAP